MSGDAPESDYGRRQGAKGPRPSKLPRLTPAESIGLLLRQGRHLAIAQGAEVTVYKLDWGDNGAEPDATVVHRHRFDGPVSGLAQGSAALLIAMVVDRDVTRLVVVDGDEARPLASLGGHGTALAAAARHAVVALERPDHLGAVIEVVELRSGASRQVATTPAARPTLTFSRRGDTVIVGDPISRQQARVRLTRDCGDDAEREPPKGPHRPADPPTDAGTGRPTHPKPCGPCDGVSIPDPPVQPPTGHRPCTPPRPHPEDDPDCRPGGGWVPGDCHDWIASGHMVIRHPRCDPGEPECKTRLDYAPASLRFVGGRLFAADGRNRRLTVLDATNLQVLHEARFGRAGAALFMAEDARQILAYRFAGARWQAIDVPMVPGTPLGIKPQPPAQSITFYGHNPDGIPPAPDTPQTGLKRVLCVPVIEPGQSFSDPNVANFGAYMQPNSFDIVNAYYDEASYGQIDVEIDLFGLDAGPADTPVQMPAPFRSYFWPPFEAGGLTAAESGLSSPYAFRLDGTEALTLRVDPRTGSTEDLVVPFAALSMSENCDLFPVGLNFSNTDSADLDVENGAGDSFSLHLQFTAETITIQSTDVDARLSDLAIYLNGIVSAAESVAGVPGGSPLFEPVEVRRIRASGLDFGSVDISLRLRPAGGDKGRVTVTGQSNLNKIGMDNAISGDFSLPSDETSLEAYLARAVRHAEAAAGYDFATRRIDSVDVGFSGGTVSTTVTIETSIGGDGASISVQSQSGLNALGFDNASSDVGVSDPNKANALKESQQFMDDFFTAIVGRLGGSVPAGFFDPYVSVLVGFVGAPPSGEWGADQPDISGLRMFTRNLTAVYEPDNSIQLQSRYIGTIFDSTPDNATLAHELGHAFGLPDLYYQAGYRDDLQYLNDWAMMDNHGQMPHFCGYHKYALGWIPESRIRPVPLPEPSGPITEDALLVPIEYWDAGMEGAVDAAFGNGVGVAQLMSIDLGGDGVQFDLVEARQLGVQYSQGLPVSPALIVTNAIDINDDTRYAEANLYRRKVHLLNTGSDLTSAGNSFDLAAAPELSAVGVSVEVVDIRAVVRPTGTVQVFHTRVTREKADYVDLCFTETTPNYKSVDVWVDWAGDNASDDSDDHRVYPEGEPIDQGETVHYPSSGTELHWVVGRIHNKGTAAARNVKIRASKWDPPGAGDTGQKAEFRSGTIEEVPAGSFVTLPLKWDVGSTESAHQCLRLDIADWELPEDPVDAIALASDDVWLSNNWAQQNVFDFVAVSGSPYEPISFKFSVTNEGVGAERCYLEPEGLAPGMKLTVTPRVTTIAPQATQVFRCVLELDENIINAGCRNDRAFMLWAWRETDEAFERWGGCKYTVRPRQKIVVELDAWWSFENIIPTSGAVVPDPGPGAVMLRVAFDGGEGQWQPVSLADGGTFSLDIPASGHEVAELMAHFEGSNDFAPGYSEMVIVAPPKPIG